MKKLALVTLVLLTITSLAFAATTAKPKPKAPPPEKVTITGTVAEVAGADGKKVTMIQTADAGDYEVAGAKAKEIAKDVGKKVKATGTVKEADGKKVMTVTMFSLVKEPPPPKVK